MNTVQDKINVERMSWETDIDYIEHQMNGLILDE
jgi:hypothetical protein